MVQWCRQHVVRGHGGRNFNDRYYDNKTSYSCPAPASKMAQRSDKRDAADGKGVRWSLGRGNKTITAI